MPAWTRRTRWITALACATAYFALAAWLDRSFVDPRPVGRNVLQLKRPFDRIGNAAIVRPTPFAECADSEDVEGGSSPVLVYEDGKILRFPHSNFGNIASTGAGAYAHWRRQGLIFSSSDNSDPNTNGRRYWAVIP